MNVLVIISQYSPAQTPNTLRWAPLIRVMQEQGHKVAVLTTKRRGLADYEECQGLSIYRAGYNTLLDWLYDILNSKSRRNETGTSADSPGFLTSIVQRLVDKTWRNRYWPDGSRLFLKPGIKCGKAILVDNKIDRVISVGLPFTAHLIGQALKEAQPSIHWHMDIQDPFCYSKEFWVNNHSRYAEKNVESERKAFELCNTATTTNAVAKMRYDRLFPETASKLSVTSPLFSQPNVDERNIEKHYGMYLYKNKLHLTYAGSFYNGVRSIEPFLKFLEYLRDRAPELQDEIQFHFLGQLDAITLTTIEAYPNVRRWFVLHGFKNRNQTMAALLQTNLVMNFGNTTDYHLPSKVVDYLYLNKPLINFTSIENDSTQAFLSDKAIPVLNLNLSEGNLEDKMKEFRTFISKVKTISEDPNPTAVVSFMPETIVNDYLAL